MSEPKPPKKSETFELRLALPTKTALMDKARAEGRAASEVVRDTIETYIADAAPEAPPKDRTGSGWRRLASALVLAPMIIAGALAVASVSTPSVAGPELGQAFVILDTDGDGQVDRAEFTAPEAAHETDIRGVEPRPGDGPALGGTGVEGDYVRFVLRGEDGDVPLTIAVGKPSRAVNDAQLAALVGTVFDRLDRNGDHMLSESEFMQK